MDRNIPHICMLGWALVALWDQFLPEVQAKIGLLYRAKWVLLGCKLDILPRIRQSVCRTGVEGRLRIQGHTGKRSGQSPDKHTERVLHKLPSHFGSHHSQADEAQVRQANRMSRRHRGTRQGICSLQDLLRPQRS